MLNVNLKNLMSVIVIINNKSVPKIRLIATAIHIKKSVNDKHDYEAYDENR
jgi:hypothetical protein